MLDEAMALPVSDRAAFIEKACGDDTALLTEVQSLLASTDDASLFFRSLADTVVQPTLTAAIEDPALDPHLQKTYGTYRVESWLARGGMGTVYRARDERLDRIAALKFLPSNRVGDATARDRLLREARAASALDHPNICTIFSVEETAGGEPFIAMALYDGETIAARIARGAIPVADSVRIITEIARGLAYAHSRGIAHRDLTPRNLMLTAGGIPKILDFGLASATVPGEKHGASGTVPYMSPEQVRQDELDPRTDVWSLGVVWYEMLTGQRPFQGDDASGTIRAIQAAAPRPIRELRPEVPRAVAALIGRMLAPRAANRPDAPALLASLEALGAGATTLRRRVLATALVTATIVVAASIIVTKVRGTPTVAATPVSRIAVLPFTNLNPDSQHAFIAAGVEDEVLAQLSKVQGLRVVSRRNERSDTTTSITDIGRMLGVDAVVRGSVQRIGDEVRVRAQLIDTRTREYLWAEYYDRPAKDLFGIRTEIALGIANALHASLAPEERDRVARQPTTNPDAYDAYLAGRAFHARPGFDPADLRLAERSYDRAVALDPDFALAHAHLSAVLSRLYGSSEDQGRQLIDAAKRSADRAIQIAPDLPEAHLALGLYEFYGNRDDTRAMAELEIARRGMSNSGEVAMAVGAIQRHQGRWNDMIASFRQGTELDPRNAATNYALAEAYADVQRFPDAIASYNRVVALDPEFELARVARADVIRKWKGDLRPLRAALDSVSRSYDPGGAITGYRWKLHIFAREYDRAIAAVRNSGRATIEIAGTEVPASVLLGVAYRLVPDSAAAERSSNEARIALESAARQRPPDASRRMLLAECYAGIGRVDDAVREGRRAAADAPAARDALSGELLSVALARVYAQAGDIARAIEALEAVAGKPVGPSVPELRLDPRWDTLRGAPRFERLVARLAPNGG
jgi:TolB-like protein